MYKFITTKEVNNSLCRQQKRQKEGVSGWLNQIHRPPLFDRTLDLNDKVVTFANLPEEDWLKYMEEGFCPAIEYLSDWVIWPHNTGAHIVCEIRYSDLPPVKSRSLSESFKKRPLPFI
jgi:hypothetical protein